MVTIKFNTIEEAIEDIRQGKMIVAVDDADRENEGRPDRWLLRRGYARGDKLYGHERPGG